MIKLLSIDNTHSRYFLERGYGAVGRLLWGCLYLFHPVEGAARLEPLKLRLVVGVVEEDGVWAAVFVLQYTLNGLQNLMERTQNVNSGDYNRGIDLNFGKEKT